MSEAYIITLVLGLCQVLDILQHLSSNLHKLSEGLTLLLGLVQSAVQSVAKAILQTELIESLLLANNVECKQAQR